MRDRHVRGLVIGLVLAFPVLMARMSPAPPPALEVAFVDMILVAGLLGAHRARRRLLAAREALIAELRPSAPEAHFAQAASASRLEKHALSAGGRSARVFAAREGRLPGETAPARTA